MRGIILSDPKTGSDLLIEPPELLPAYALCTKVIAKIVDESDQLVTIEGEIIGIEIAQDYDTEDNTVSTIIGYKVLRDGTKQVYQVNEDEIIEYYPDTNEFNIAYHLDETN